MSSDFTVGPQFVSRFAVINNLPQVTDIANMGFDIFAMFWFGFLSTIMDTKLKDFAKKMKFVAGVQQALSDVSTSFSTIKEWKSATLSMKINQVDSDNLSKAFFSLVRYKAMLSARFMKVGGNPFGKTMLFNTDKTVGIGRWNVSATGKKQSPPKGVPNPLKDTTLANKIGQLIADLAKTNTTQISATKYTEVTAYTGNLVNDLLVSDPFFTASNDKNSSGMSSAFSNKWKNTVPASLTTIWEGPIRGLATQYISFNNARGSFATPATSSILSNAATDASTGVTAAQSLSGTTEIQLDQFEQVENMYNNIRSQIQQSIAQRNLLVIKNSGSAG